MAGRHGVGWMSEAEGLTDLTQPDYLDPRSAGPGSSRTFRS